MLRYEAARIYSHAIFSLTISNEQMISRAQLFTALTAIWKQSPAFTQFFLNPEIALEEKENIFKKAIADTQLIHFFLLLLSKKRFKYLPEIAENYQKLAATKNGQLLAALESSTSLDSALKIRLQIHLEKAFGNPLLLRTQKATSSMRGAVLVVGNKIFDGSIKGRLERMKKTLEES